MSEPMTVDEIRDQVSNHGWTMSAISGVDPEIGELMWHVTIKAGEDDWCTGVGFDAGEAAQRAIQGLLASLSEPSDPND